MWKIVEKLNKLWRKEKTMEFEDELKAMDKVVVDFESVMTEGPKTSPPSTDPPGEFYTDPPEEGPKTAPPATDPPSGDETKPPSTTAPVTTPPVDFESKFNDLLSKFTELENKLTKPKTEPPPTDPPIEEQDFLKSLGIEDDDDLEDVLKDKTKLNKLFNQIYSSGIKEAVKLTPVNKNQDEVFKAFEILTTMKEIGEKFYKENDDLLPHRQAISEAFGEQFKTNPNRKYIDILTEAEKTVRTKLNLPKKQNPVVDKTKPPYLPKKRSQQRQKQKPNPSNFDTELNAMDEALRR